MRVLHLLLFCICLWQFGCDANTEKPQQQPSESNVSLPTDKPAIDQTNPEEQLQGSWVAVRGEAKGEPTLLDGFSFAFQNGEFKAVSPGNTAKGTYQLDVTKSPMHITFEGVGYGIFRFQDDELHLCIDRDHRPRSFSTSMDSWEILTICKRNE